MHPKAIILVVLVYYPQRKLNFWIRHKCKPFLVGSTE